MSSAYPELGPRTLSACVTVLSSAYQELSFIPGMQVLEYTQLSSAYPELGLSYTCVSPAYPELGPRTLSACVTV